MIAKKALEFKQIDYKPSEKECQSLEQEINKNTKTGDENTEEAKEEEVVEDRGDIIEEILSYIDKWKTAGHDMKALE